MHNHKATLVKIILIITTLQIQAQQVMPESEQMTEEERYKQNIFHHVLPELESKFGTLFDKIPNVGNRTNGLKKEGYNKLLTQSNTAIAIINNNSLKAKCENINRVRKSINEYHGDKCIGVKNKLAIYKKNIQWANDKLKGIKQEEGKEDNHQAEMQNISSQLDQELENFAVENEEYKRRQKNNKAQSLDEFLEETGIGTESTDPYDFLEKLENEDNDSLASNNDDFLESPTGDFLEESEDNQKSYEIKYKDGLTGVIDKNGKVLIPFKKWSIRQYKNGIAEVSEEIDFIGSCTDEGRIVANRSGFVDETGEYLDTTNINFRHDKYSKLTLSMTPSFSSPEKRQAYKRMEARMRREERLEEQKCKTKATKWKNKILAQYN